MKKSNYIYLLINFFLILFIIALNFFVDPYFLFNKERPLHISRYLLDEPYIPLKLYKDKKYDYVITGGSTVNVLNLGNFNKNLADISSFKIKAQDMKTLLFEYLNMHPETKTVFLPVDYRQLSNSLNTSIPEFKEKEITSKDIIRLFVSIKTLNYSFKKLFTRLPDYSIALIRYKLQDVKFKKEDIEKLFFETYTEIFDELNKRNIKVVCFIPPMHANRTVYLNEKIGYQTLLNIKKFIISKNGYLIDMSTINKFTSKPIKESFYLFSDAIHASDIYGYFIYNILFDTQNKDKDLYLYLTKDNVEFYSRIEKEKADKWLKDNTKEYKYYADGKKPKCKEKIYHSINDVPKEFKNILNHKKSIFYKN